MPKGASNRMRPIIIERTNSLQLKRSGIQPVVAALLGEQLLMIPPLDYLLPRSMMRP